MKCEPLSRSERALIVEELMSLTGKLEREKLRNHALEARVCALEVWRDSRVTPRRTKRAIEQAGDPDT